MPFRQDHFRHGAQRHQNHRHQRGPDADAKARHLRFAEGFRVIKPFGDRLIDIFQKARINRPGEDHRWDRQQRAEQQGFAHIGVKQSGDSGRTRMRRQKTVGDGKRRRHRHADIKQRHARRRGDAEHQRQQQHETDFIEQRKADGKTGQHHRPLNMTLAEFRNQRRGDALRTAAVGQQLTQHRAEAHNQRQAAERAAHAGFNRSDNLIDRHALHHAHRQRNQNQRDKSI